MSDSSAIVGRAWLLSLSLHALLFVTLLVLAGGPPRRFEPQHVDEMPIEVRFYLGEENRRSADPEMQSPDAPIEGAAAEPPRVLADIGAASAAIEPTPEASHVPSLDAQEMTDAVPSPVRTAAAADVGATPGSVRPAIPARRPGFFGVPLRGRTIVYVIDRSASMGAYGRIELARKELADSLTELAANTRFQVVAYNRAVEAVFVGTGPRIATGDTIDRAIRWFAELPAEGGHDHRKALNFALGLAAEEIILFTDGEGLAEADAYEIARGNRDRATIHVVIVGRTRDRFREAARRLARLNRGEFREVDGP